jgi:DNA-3-methyladenine glycosylase
MQEIGNYSDSNFFDRDVQEVSKDLLGRVLEHLVDGVWLSVRIIETEAYYGQGQEDSASHASLGYTENR